MGKRLFYFAVVRLMELYMLMMPQDKTRMFDIGMAKGYGATDCSMCDQH